MFGNIYRNKISKWGVLETRILRYAFGSTLAMAIAMGFAWPLSYLVPVLILGFLKPGAKPPTLRSSLNFVLVIGVACLLGLFISQYLLDYPLIHLPLMGLLFLHLFYAKKASINPDLKTWIMVAGLMIPIMGLSGQEEAFMVAVNILVGAVIMMVVNAFVYLVLPESNIEISENEESKQVVEISQSERLSEALTSLVVVMPVVVLFYLFNWSSNALVLIFVAILASMPAISKSFNLGRSMIIGNLFGGVMTIIMYEILVMIPQYYFLIWIIFFAGLYLGYGLFSDKKTAPLFGMAFSTLIVVIGSATISGAAEAGDKVWVRIMQIALAVSYVVLAYRFIDTWKAASQGRKIKKVELS